MTVWVLNLREGLIFVDMSIMHCVENKLKNLLLQCKFIHQASQLPTV